MEKLLTRYKKTRACNEKLEVRLVKLEQENEELDRENALLETQTAVLRNEKDARQHQTQQDWLETDESLQALQNEIEGRRILFTRRDYCRDLLFMSSARNRSSCNLQNM